MNVSLKKVMKKKAKNPQKLLLSDPKRTVFGHFFEAALTLSIVYLVIPSDSVILYSFIF